MIIPYRIQQALKRLGIGLLVLLVLASVVLLCWFLWLQRYVVYTEDGAKLNFDIALQFPDGQVAQKPTTGSDVNLIYGDEIEATGPANKEMERFSGYYVTVDAMREDFDAVAEQIGILPSGATVMFDMKSIRGEFCYNTGLGHIADDIPLDRLADVMAQLKENGCYLMAKIPAFRDYHFFMDDERTRVPYGLARDGGNGALWMDKQSCYWFNPASEGAMTYLIQIVSEIRALGFHEVVFDDFRFPDTDMYTFLSDELKAINNAATTLVNTCATETFAVSFVRRQADLQLPEGRTRLYIENAAVAELAAIAERTGFADPAIQLGFLVETNDTRYDAYCVLRPIHMAR